MDKRQNHIIFWVCFPLYYGTLTFIALKDTLPYHTIFLRIFLGCSISFMMFYFFAFSLLPKTLSNKKYGIFFLGIIMSLIGATIIHFIYIIFLHNVFPKLFPMESPIISFTRIIFPTIRAMYLAFPYWYLKLLFSEINHKKETEEKLFLLKKTVSDSELLGLKNQINPHFLYNILNFLYSQALPFSSKLSNSILTLSEMMRYSITENDNMSKVPLEREIDYIKKYIELENLQQKNSNPIQLKLQGNLNYRRILPMTFQPILESCIKFGENIILNFEIHESHVNLVSEFTKKNDNEIDEMYSHFQNIKENILRKNQEKISLNITFEGNILKLHLLLNS